MARVRAHHPGPDRALSSSGSLQGFLITPHLRPACLFRVALPPHPRTRAFPFLFHCICLPFSRQVASFDRHTNPTLRRLLVTAAITVPLNPSNSHHSFCVFDRQRHQLGHANFTVPPTLPSFTSWPGPPGTYPTIRPFIPFTTCRAGPRSALLPSFPTIAAHRVIETKEIDNTDTTSTRVILHSSRL